MKIEGPREIRHEPGVKGARGATGDGAAFARLVTGGPGTAAPAAGLAASTATGALAGLLAVQAGAEDEAEAGRRRRAGARGQRLLEVLEGLKLDLLAGEVGPERLGALAEALASERAAVSDPALSQVLDEIDLRAAVELAKRERRAV